jgi:transketolase
MSSGTEATKGAAVSADGSNGARTFDAERARRLARRIRLRAARMVARHGLGYLGQALSSAELVSALCTAFWRPDRDRFVLSPGHYVIAAYAAGAELGLLAESELASYGDDGSRLAAIGTESTPVVDMTCGSLGQGLSCAAGMALADRLDGSAVETYALLSDGEMQEGQVWEAALFAAHHRLDRLVAVVDCNNSQVDGPVADVIGIEPLAEKWRSFGWAVRDVDGHDVVAVAAALTEAVREPTPAVVLARTSVTQGVAALPPETDGHFIKLPDPLAEAVIAELQETEGGTDA